jgi:hypothetical protein
LLDGCSTVDREMSLSGGIVASGPVRSIRYLANGSLMSEVCGEAVSARF